jgi:5-methylthioribose kinase
LVHGDYSPKNILLHRGRLVLLDQEVIHFGDPAFDLGFSLTHFLSKAHHLRPQRAAFLEASHWFWENYKQVTGEWACEPTLEARIVRHTLACLLARVDGRSPLEYLTDLERQRQREIVLSLMRDLPASPAALVENFGGKLNE